MGCDELQALIQSYVDGELDTVSAIEVEQHLQGCRSCALACDDLQRLKTALRDRALYVPAPLALRQRLATAIMQESGGRPATVTQGNLIPGATQVTTQVIAGASAAPKPVLSQATRNSFTLASLRSLRMGQSDAGRWRRVTAITATAVMVCLALVGWNWRQRIQTDAAVQQVTQEVVASHVRSLLVNHLTDLASSDPHTVQSWFPGKINFAVAVAQPSPSGSRLLGARLDYAANKPLAALIYTEQRHIINVFIGTSLDDMGRDKDETVRETAISPATKSNAVSFQISTQRGYHLCRMVQGGLTYWVVSDLETAKLATFAQQIIPSVSNHCA